MPKIALSEPWTYRTPLATVDFPAGEHEVTEDIAALAPSTPAIKDETHDRTATPRAPRRADKAEG